MAAKFNVQVTLSRAGDVGDPKGAWGPRTYAVELPGLIDQELELKIPAGGVDIPIAIPTVGVNTQVVFIRCDLPGVTYRRNAEVIVNPLGAGGFRLEAGAPANSTPLTTLLFSNPGTVPATVYALVAGA